MTTLKELERRLTALENMTGGKGVSVTRRPGGVVIAMKPTIAPTTSSSTGDCSGGEVLELHRLNPEVDWDRYDENRRVRLIGNYVTWVECDEKNLILHYRVLTYDKCWRVKSISAESKTIIDEAVECICDGSS